MEKREQSPELLELEALARKLLEVCQEAAIYEAAKNYELARERLVKAWMVLNRIDRTLAKLYGALDDLEGEDEDGDGAERARLALVLGEEDDGE